VKEYAKERGVVNDKVYSIILDLDDLESVKAFPGRLSAAVGQQQVNVLINNAGVMAIPDRQITKDGFEAYVSIQSLRSLCIDIHADGQTRPQCSHH
jgi:NAD(P)-dependent dehydrogenase (short-subunit alcohol dehydrogenase family)